MTNNAIAIVSVVLITNINEVFHPSGKTKDVIVSIDEVTTIRYTNRLTTTVTNFEWQPKIKRSPLNIRDITPNIKK